MNQPKKKPEDYASFSFRITKEQKKELNSLLEKAYLRINPSTKDPQRKEVRIVNYNRMMIYVLKNGLPKLKRSDFEK